MGKVDRWRQGILTERDGSIRLTFLLNRTLSPTRWCYQSQVLVVAFLKNWILFCSYQKALAFNQDRCCHLVLCLQLILFHWSRSSALNIEHIFYCFAKQAILLRRPIVQSLPFSYCSLVRLSTVDLLVPTSLDFNITFNIENIFYCFEKQAILMRRSTVLSHPFSYCFLVAVM